MSTSTQVIITGGAGFIGTNTAIRFAQLGHAVTLIDDFSRDGSRSNIEYMLSFYPAIKFIESAVQTTTTYAHVLKNADVVVHLAGQTAVTHSIANPSLDFQTNLVGTFQLLEAIRATRSRCIFIYSSTNKVYGDLPTHELLLDTKSKRYQNISHPNGVSEDQQLDFLSPYGVSKGSADQYVKDWAHTYGLQTVVFRQSCIYGPHQRGVEDQGWVAHFAKQILTHKPIVIFGDGYQVRDLLHVDDLVEAYLKSIDSIDKCAGQVFNIGGGVKNSYSLHQVLDILQNKIGIAPQISISDERLADQKYYVSNNSKLKKVLGWEPETDFLHGVTSMIEWMQKEYDCHSTV